MHTSRYPDYPDLTTEHARAELAAIWAAGDSSHPLWQASVLNEFQRATSACEPINPWILGFLHKQFHWVLSGSAWDDAFKLPDRELPDEWAAMSRTDTRNANYWAETVNLVKAGETATGAIAKVAAAHHKSFETVRAAYYDWPKRMSVSNDSDEFLEG